MPLVLVERTIFDCPYPKKVAYLVPYRRYGSCGNAETLRVQPAIG
jgi:hypothetical protein